MRSVVQAVVLGALLLLPSEAHLSGSSLVHADSQYFRVQIESVRKIFGDTDGEGEWHHEWKVSHQPIVNRIKKKLEPEMAPLVESHHLLPFKPGLPEVIDDAQDTDEAIEAIRSKKPFQLRFRYELASVCIVVPKLPTKAERRELAKFFKKHMPRSD